MGIEEFLPAILVIAVIYYAIRWFMGPSQTINPDGSIPGVTASMVETIQSAFPDIPLVNIVYHLSKTRSAQATSEEILERGFLPAPPAGYQIPPSLAPTQAPTTTNTSPVIGKRTVPSPGKSLIDRYGLSARIPSVDKGKAKAEDEQPGQVQGQGAGKWEGSKEERERGLRERKEKMVLEARRKMMERQQEQARKAEQEKEEAIPTYIA